jgi:hypothetical protein
MFRDTEWLFLIIENASLFPNNKNVTGDKERCRITQNLFSRTFSSRSNNRGVFTN